MSLITVSSLSKSFGAFDLFSGVAFAIPKGARLALVGPNGVGKTTLLRILVGRTRPRRERYPAPGEPESDIFRRRPISR